jgi:hypothetical protein
VLLPLGVGVAMVPASRDLVVRACWHVITPHRVRRGLVEAGVYSRKGRVPEVLRVRSVPVGEALTLWCFAGTSFEEIVAGARVIGIACYAKEVQVRRHERHSHLVHLVVVRRPQAQPPDAARLGEPTGPSDGPREIYRPNAAVQKAVPADLVGEESTEMPAQRRRHSQSALGGGGR